jgi:hypothetical protein
MDIGMYGDYAYGVANFDNIKVKTGASSGSPAPVP